MSAVPALFYCDDFASTAGAKTTVFTAPAGHTYTVLQGVFYNGHSEYTPCHAYIYIIRSATSTQTMVKHVVVRQGDTVLQDLSVSLGPGDSLQLSTLIPLKLIFAGIDYA